MTGVSLCMVVRDGLADGVELAIASARPFVDEVCIWENGSSDGTVELLERLAAEPGAPICIEHGTWTDDFSAARNASSAIASREWLLSLDANDSLVGGERLREVVARADASAADIAWCFWDRYANDRHGWWPSLVRAGTGSWQGVVHECWRRPGIDRWRHGVGQLGSVHVHPAVLRVFHRDRVTTPFKYLALLHKAAEDPERTPWALAALADELRGIDDKRAVALYEQHLLGGYDDVEGASNALHASTLQELANVYERLGDPDASVRYRREWDAYTRKLTRALGEHAEFLLQLGDEAQVAEWAAMKPETVDVLLEAPAATRPSLGRNDPCWCGSGKKYKRCHG